MVFIIIADIRSNDPVIRERIDAAVRTMGNWSNRLDKAWLLETDRLGARGIRDQLKQFLSEPDRLFVARISKNWAARNMGNGFSEWMGRRSFGEFPNG